MSSTIDSILSICTIGGHRLRAYLILCKHKVVALMLLSALVGILLDYHASFPWGQACASLLGIGLLAAAGGATNQILDMRRDKTMQRTQNRPLVNGTLPLTEAILVVILLSTSGTTLLWYVSNPLATYLTLGAMIGYAGIYTMILKPITPQNIVIGGINGALPPLLGWVAMVGHIDTAPVLLVLIIYTWTPPHFWALAIAKYSEYAAAGTPMLPVTHGIPYTKWHIILYTILLYAVSLLPVVIGLSGVLYGLGMLVLNTRYLTINYQLYCSASHAHAMQSFLFSIHYLLWLFLLILTDHMITTGLC